LNFNVLTIHLLQTLEASGSVDSNYLYFDCCW